MSEEHAYSLRRRSVGRGELGNFEGEISGVVEIFHGDALDSFSSQCSSLMSAFSPETKASSERFLHFVAVVVSSPELSSRSTCFGFMLDTGDCGTKL